MNVQFVFDYRSPYAYLASSRLEGLGHPVSYLPVDILAVMKSVNNQPSPACPAKAKYSGIDAARWAALYGVALAPNQALWKKMRTGEFDGSLLSKVAVAAQQQGLFERLHAELFQAIWAGTDDLTSDQGRAEFLHKLNIEQDLWAQAQSEQSQQQLLANNALAVQKGVFGVPTFFCDDEMFFGNDRLDFVRAAIKNAQEA